MGMTTQLTRAMLAATMLWALMAPPAQGGEPSADIRVVQSVHHDGRYSDPGPVYDGAPEIPDEIWFVYDFYNDGPNAATVKLNVDPDTFKYRSPGKGGYNYWTVPMQTTGSWWQGGLEDCRRFSCSVRLQAGRSYRFMIMAEANAPGPFSIYARVTSPDSADPDLSNNRTETWAHRVRCKINGTDGADRLKATPEPDSICGGAGADHLIGVGKDDKVFGQKGNDVMVRQPGNNQSYLGGPGRDTISLAKMNSGQSVSLRDRTAGGAAVLSVEKAIGSPFNDYLTGLLGRDWIFGGPGDDRIAGRGGRDVANGGKGNDRFISRDGTFDIVDGGPGSDVCQADPGDRVRSADRVSSPPFYLDP